MSSLCATTVSLGKKTNKEIMSLGGPRKRTRLSLWKKAAKVVAGTGSSPLDTILYTAKVGKETARMIKELQ